jgi:hypothetical protein
MSDLTTETICDEAQVDPGANESRILRYPRVCWIRVKSEWLA